MVPQSLTQAILFPRDNVEKEEGITAQDSPRSLVTSLCVMSNRYFMAFLLKNRAVPLLSDLNGVGYLSLLHMLHISAMEARRALGGRTVWAMMSCLLLLPVTRWGAAEFVTPRDIAKILRKGSSLVANSCYEFG